MIKHRYCLSFRVSGCASQDAIVVAYTPQKAQRALMVHYAGKGVTVLRTVDLGEYIDGCDTEENQSIIACNDVIRRHSESV